MNGVSYLELLKLAAPETIVVLTVLVVLAADLLALRGLELRFRLLDRRDDRLRRLRRGDRLDAAPCRSTATFARRHAGGGPADPVRQGRAAGADDLHRAHFGGHGLHHARGRILRADPAGDGRDDVPGQLRGYADDLHLARTDQPLALHPDGVQQAQPQVGGSGAEVFPVRRHVGGLHAVRLEPALRPVRRDQPWPDRRGDRRARGSTRCWWWRS